MRAMERNARMSPPRIMLPASQLRGLMMMMMTMSAASSERARHLSGAASASKLTTAVQAECKLHAGDQSFLRTITRSTLHFQS